MTDEKIDLLKLIRDNQLLHPDTQKSDFPENYPFYDKKADVTVTFICPILTGESVYKMIYPALAMNLYSETHRAFLYAIRDFIVKNQMDDYSSGISIPDTFIAISDYMVFPFFIFEKKDEEGDGKNMWEIWEVIRKMKPGIKIVYCVDTNFLRMPVGYPGYKQYESQKTKDTIIENMRYADIVLITQQALGEFLFSELKDQLQGSPTTIEVMPCGFFPEIIDPIIHSDSPSIDHPTFRMGMIANPTHADDLNCIRDQLITLKGKYRDQLEILSFGWRGIADFGKGMRDTFRGIPVDYKPPVNFYQYYQKLAEYQFDCMLLPVKLTEDQQFTLTSKNYQKYIEASSMGIPCLITSIAPFKDTPYMGDGFPLIKTGETGILIEKKADWVTEVSAAIEEKKEITGSEENKDKMTRLDTIGIKAYAQAHERFTYQHIIPWIERIFE